MFRVALTIVLPLALPTVVYLLWATARRQPGGGTELQAQDVPWLWLAGSGVVLLAAVLVFVSVHFGTAETGLYIPPHWENGQITPGHIDPTRHP
ncbi:MAG TPA: DUF6111 family protein [Stellaceae bacterium]|jgi:hypothetical protein|nr:DUF6111 family protein [Stellaceae bacterium]